MAAVTVAFAALLLYFAACSTWPDHVVPVPPEACERAAEAMRSEMKSLHDVDAVVCWPADESVVLHGRAACDLDWRPESATYEERLKLYQAEGDYGT